MVGASSPRPALSLGAPPCGRQDEAGDEGDLQVFCICATVYLLRQSIVVVNCSANWPCTTPGTCPVVAQLHVVHRTDSADVHDAISPMHPRNTVTALRLPCLRLFDHAALLLNRGLLELQVVFLHAACGLSDILAVPRRRHTRQSRAASRETIDAC